MLQKVDMDRELMDFNYRELTAPLNSIFPNIDMAKLKEKYSPLVATNPHQTILNVALSLWHIGYNEITKDFGFWDKNCRTFEGHCHQCTPILGAVLKALGFKVAYLEGYRIRNHFLKTGMIDKVAAEEEPKESKLRNDFIRIKRIPYCCLEVYIREKPYYISGKHIKQDENGNAKALLTPMCYMDFEGVFRHPLDSRKSGIYLQPIIPVNNLQKADFSKRVVWAKQTFKDLEPELFATYARINFE